MLKFCPDASLWMYNSSIDGSHFCNLPKSLLIDFSKNAIEHRLNNKGLDDYDFDVFYEKNGSTISKKIPKELFKIIISSLLQKQKKETYWYFDLSRDTFATIVENNEGRLENEPENSIIRFLVNCIENMPFAYVLSFVNSNISSNNTFLCALSIYICNIYFSKLKSLFLKHVDLLNNRDYFSEIYSLLKCHCVELSDKETELVFSKIDNMAFSGEYSRIYMAAYKLDLYKLLYDSGVVAAQRYILKINSSFTKEELVSISQFPSPENKSKKVWISSSWISSGNEIEKKITQFSKENYLGFVKSTKEDDYDAKSAISTTLKAEIKKLNLLPLFEANNFEMFYELPNYYKLYLITFFTETSNNYPLDKLATICLDVKKRLDENFFCEFFNSFCRGLYFRLTSSKEMLKGETIELLSNFIIDNFPADSNYWYPQNNNLESSAFNALLSADSFYSLNALIILCETNSWPKVKSILVSFIDDSSKKYIAKASVVANTNKIFLFDKNLISDNIKILFDNEYKGFNLSYSAFNFSLYSNKEFIGILNDNEILIPLASSVELKDNSWAFICNILFSFISGNIDKEIIDKIIVLENAESAFSRLIDVCLKNTSHWSKAVEEKVNYIINKAVFSNHKGSLEMLASKLLNLTKILTNRNIAIAKACFYLSRGSNSYYAKDIGNCLNLTTLSNDEKIKILSSFIDGLKEGVHNVNDIVALFSCINWAKKENQKNELVNKLKLLDPEFEVILQR